VTQEDFSHLEGHRFPGGSYRLPAHEAWLWADATGGAPGDELAPPEIGYMVGLHGGGASIADIMRLFEADEDSGVLFGELTFEIESPLRPEVEYEVGGGIIAVERKRGRQAGVFDRATFVHELTATGEAEPSMRVTHVWIFPRAGAGA
jgi:hypothetical protein